MEKEEQLSQATSNRSRVDEMLREVQEEVERDEKALQKAMGEIDLSDSKS